MTWLPSLAVSMLLLLPAVGAAAEGPRLSPAQLRQDLAAIDAVLHRSHPDVGHSASPAALGRQMRAVAARLDHPMTRDEAWRVFATLNPVLQDAHLGVFVDNWRGEARAHLDGGGVFFPYEVDVAADGALRVGSSLGGGETPLAGARILAINGMDADVVVRTLLARAHGDTAGFRAGLLSRRFWFFYWKMYGARTTFDIRLDRKGRRTTLHLPGSHEQPVQVAKAGQFEREFAFELLPCHGALLTVNTFDWPDKKRFLDFTHDAFGRMKAAGVRTLIIDIRANEGGDDDMWMEGILPYVATSRYRWASAYRKRVMEADPAKGEAVGDVVSGPLDRWLEADPGNPLRYSGKTYVLIGRATYSSAVLFTNVVQHFGFGAIAGVGGIARSDQSGGTRSTVLANSGLVVGWPRFILTSPAGKAAPKFVEPDIAIPRDPLRPRLAIDRLMSCDATRRD